MIFSLKQFALMAMTVVMLTASLAFLSEAHAGVTATAPVGKSGLVEKCEDYPGITNRIVKCVRGTLKNAGSKFFKDFYPLISKAVTAFLTIGVAIYGVMMAAGMVEKIGRDSMVMLLKIAFVAYFVQNVDMLYEMVVQLMDQISAKVFTFATLNHPTAPVCMTGKLTVWERMDCLVDTLFGLKTDIGGKAVDAASATANPKISGNGLARGLIAFFGSAMLSSVPGFIIGLIGFMFLYTMLFFMIKVVFVYLMSYMAILFLMIIGPLFMPLVIFKSTKQYFDNWTKLITACALQPIIIITFVSFAVATVDVTVFSGEKSFVRTIAGDAAKEPKFNLNYYIESKGAYKKHTRGPTLFGASSRNVADGAEVRQGITGSTLVNECGLRTATTTGGLSGGVSAAADCAEGWVVGISTREIDWKILAEKRSPAVVKGKDDKNLEQAFMRELYAAAILTGVMMFILNALMQVVPQLANDLVGSYRQTPNMMGLAGGWKWQQSGGQAASNLARSITNMQGRR